MRRRITRAVIACLVCLVSVASTIAAQSPTLIMEVRQAIAQNDFTRGDRLLADYRTEHGVTSHLLAAMSWMARGALAERRWPAAEQYADDTYRLASSLLAKRPLDQDADLPIALGAAIEVLAEIDAQRGARSDAIRFLQSELATHKGTSIEKRIQKNINLLSLEGTVAPPLDLSDYLGAAPPALSALKGKVVLLFFWAHWCSDCKAQSPILADLQARYGSQGLVIVAPTQRFGYIAGGRPATADDETRYIAQVRASAYPVLAGQPIPLSEANHRRYGVSSTPTLVLVDRSGMVRLYHPGRMTQDALEPFVKRLVEGSAGR